MSKSKLIIAVPLLLAAVAGGGYYWWTQVRFIETTDNAYVEADISHISVKVPGYVVLSDVTDNQHVQKGELLAQLEDNQFSAKVSQAEASLASSKADLQTLAAKVELQRALITQASAGVVAAESDKIRAQQQLSRSKKLKVSNYSSQDDVDQLQAGFDSAAARLDEAKAVLVAKQRELAVFNAQLDQAGSVVEQADATLELAKIQLNDTRVTAPFSGVIGKRGAMVGQYVQPGQALYSLVPDGAVWITANFKETQIQHMQPGQSVQVSLDAFPDKTFIGVIDSLSPASGAKFSLLPAENATGNFTKIVQRIPVRIRLDLSEEEAHMLPGLSAVVKVDTASGPATSAIAANTGR
ncbi:MULTISPECIES: HlyD family secretion protein [Shewanella]|jgi:membrane fusion protein, multidrug efflux system|uniref:HlyD family secretion protein n=1 Tax=Shewanella septentrionalis TaxID=2952223 RepID=A0A9X2WS02_9GAMM|nr:MULTISPECIES: HlyD family secretion protein [Shewanella]AEG12990.1 secretion protein HlyD family protein [Shewanella baltica BA175]EHQ13467.1 secretion protein HlyD family protein [Shewanella baltica OS183]MCS6162365.1 HlyD family secretion protein [Shewanella baltica]MCS6178634.1 HlyD family secretion protein [Shewanella baltica]MCS6254940.1 HlyD family secretion protein [Shewanella baltica]